MKCRLDGCEKDAMYKKEQLCQMHYFRRIRNGDFELKKCSEYKRPVVRGGKYRISNPRGYCLVKEPGHHLAQKNGYVYEHRKVLFDAVGNDANKCEMCGADWSWESIYYSHVDHIDGDVTNNTLDNLRPLCNTCNSRRNLAPLHTRKNSMAVTIDGVTKTPSEWSSHENCFVSHQTIKRRIESGFDPADAVFGKSKTLKSAKHKKRIGC